MLHQIYSVYIDQVIQPRTEGITHKQVRDIQVLIAEHLCLLSPKASAISCRFYDKKVGEVPYWKTRNLGPWKGAYIGLLEL